MLGFTLFQFHGTLTLKEYAVKYSEKKKNGKIRPGKLPWRIICYLYRSTQYVNRLLSLRYYFAICEEQIAKIIARTAHLLQILTSCFGDREIP